MVRYVIALMYMFSTYVNFLYLRARGGRWPVKQAVSVLSCARGGRWPVKQAVSVLSCARGGRRPVKQAVSVLSCAYYFSLFGKQYETQC